MESALASMQPRVSSISPSPSGSSGAGSRESSGIAASIMIKNRQIIAPTLSTLCTLESTISPKESGILSIVFSPGVLVSSLALILRYRSPFKRALSACETNKIPPTAAFFNSSAPTVPTMNIGPELEQKLHMRKASVFEILPLSYKSAVIFEPTG